MDNRNIEENIKILLIGNSSTGKTSICRRWINKTFDVNYKATIMCEFCQSVIEFKGKLYKVQLWDIGGQDKSIHASNIIMKNTHGCVVVSDITDRKSLEDTTKWKKLIDENQKFVDGKDLPFVLLQNKCDLVSESEMNDDRELNKIAKENGYINAFKTSAKEGININEALKCLTDEIIQRLIVYNESHSKKDKVENISLSLYNKPQVKRKGCC